ncbi:hypothetical protein HPP92_018379 [Vanilla planifolia]|uniref:Uncharacterized protein n=1 Tax=Vanilla planifolia TaxID=51239 RepID=A0A835QBX3_VANPL|nr:hypothetical protein HPP92_018379 [Vanilla planifolia]
MLMLSYSAISLESIGAQLAARMVSKFTDYYSGIWIEEDLLLVFFDTRSLGSLPATTIKSPCEQANVEVSHHPQQETLFVRRSQSPPFPWLEGRKYSVLPTSFDQIDYPLAPCSIDC